MIRDETNNKEDGSNGSYQITEILNCDFNEINDTCIGLTNQVDVIRALSIDSYSYTDVTSICI